MTGGTRRFIRDAAAAIQVLADDTATLFGVRHALVDAERTDDLPLLTAEDLANELYWRLHCRVEVRRQAPEPAHTDGETAAFVRELSLANDGRGPWQDGWTVEAAARGDRLVVRAFDVNFTAARRDVRVDGRPVRGAQAQVRVPKEYRRFAPGYYTALGDLDHEPATTPTARIYWNVGPGGAASLVASLTQRLNRAAIPFRFKTPDDPARFERCDTGILYVPRSALRALRPHLQRAWHDVRDYLREPLSGLTCRVARGVGAAHDPGDGGSFGSHRCGLIANAVVAAIRGRAAGGGRGGARSDAIPAGRVAEQLEAAVTASLRSLGLDPARLYLAPGEPDDLAALRTGRGRR